MNPSESIIQRSFNSVSWNFISHIVRLVVSFTRTCILARLLPVGVFGIYGLSTSLVSLTSVVASFGMAGAFIHRAPETENEDLTAAVHFTIKFCFTLIWLTIITTCILFFASGEMKTPLLVISITTGGIHLTQTPILILNRRVMHRRLALLSLCHDLISTPIVLFLAFKGFSLWALLSLNIIEICLNILLLYIWKPVWRPRFAWSHQIVRYFLKFGSRNFLAVALLRALNKIYQLWIGFFQGIFSQGCPEKNIPATT